ncbi:MAG: glycosyltransferase family 4 protein [Chloroflexota bacterium]|nr:glycosyltransferase family 4 protein [Chloroflexota bacterium]
MKICLVSPYDYPYPGGVTEQVKGLEKHLRLRGHSVTILAPSSEEDDVPVPGNVRRLGDIVELPANGSRARISLSLGISRTVRGILAREAFDVIHLHEPLMPTIPLIVLRQSLTCNVGTFHAYGDESLAYAAARPLLRSYFDRLHGRIAVSQAACDYVSQYFPADYTIIPNGIDVERFATPQPPLERYHDGRPTILFVGRFEEQRKGFRTLLQALPLVRMVCPEVRVVVVGKGDPELFADLLPSEPGVVEFAGYVSAADLPRYYQGCTVYCAPSTGQESFGVVLLEAMAAGAPIVASRCAGYAAVMQHGREGFLFEPRNPEQLAVALVRTLSDPGLRAAMIGQGHATAARYNWPLVVAQVETYYEQALGVFRASGGGGVRFSLRRLRHLTPTGLPNRLPPRIPAGDWDSADRTTLRLSDLLGTRSGPGRPPGDVAGRGE